MHISYPKKKLKIALLAIFLAAVGLLVAQFKYHAFSEPTYTIVGGIYAEDNTKQALNGVSVTLMADNLNSPITAKTYNFSGNNGYYRLTVPVSVTSGTLSFTKDGYYDTEIYFNLPDVKGWTISVSTTMKPGFGKETGALYSMIKGQAKFLPISFPFTPTEANPTKAFNYIYNNGQTYWTEPILSNYAKYKVKLYSEYGCGVLKPYDPNVSDSFVLEQGRSYYLTNESNRAYFLVLKGKPLYEDFSLDLNSPRCLAYDDPNAIGNLNSPVTPIGNPYPQPITTNDIRIIDTADSNKTYTISKAITSNLIEKDLKVRTGLNAVNIQTLDLTQLQTLLPTKGYLMVAKKPGLRIKIFFPSPDNYVEVPEDVTINDIKTFAKHDPSLPLEEQERLLQINRRIMLKAADKFKERPPSNDIIILTKNGIPILPGLTEYFKNSLSLKTASNLFPSAQAEEPLIEYVFDRESWGSDNPQPWAEKVNTIKNNLSKIIEPSPVRIRVLVVKDSTVPAVFGGIAQFFPSTNALVFDPDYNVYQMENVHSPTHTLIHEMVHSFSGPLWKKDWAGRAGDESFTNAITYAYTDTFLTTDNINDYPFRYYEKLNNSPSPDINFGPLGQWKGGEFTSTSIIEDWLPLYCQALWQYKMAAEELYKVYVEYPDIFMKTYRSRNEIFSQALANQPEITAQLKILYQKAAQAEGDELLKAEGEIDKLISELVKKTSAKWEHPTFSSFLVSYFSQNPSAKIEEAPFVEWEKKQKSFQLINLTYDGPNDNQKLFMYPNNPQILSGSSPGNFFNFNYKEDTFEFHRLKYYPKLTPLSNKIARVSHYDHANIINSAASQISDSTGSIEVKNNMQPGRNRLLLLPDLEQTINKNNPEIFTGWDIYDDKVAQISKKIGLFGIIDIPTDGTIAINHIPTGQTFTKPVINGIFTAPETFDLKGSFAITYIKDSINIKKIINKGKGDYYLFFQTDTKNPTINKSSIGTEVVDNKTTKLWFRVDELSSALLEYGLDTNYGNLSFGKSLDASNPFSPQELDQIQGTHIATIGNLEPGKTYHARLWAIDRSGNYSHSDDFTFNVSAQPQVQLTELKGSTQQNGASATLSVTTAAPSQVTVDYGTTTSYGLTKSSETASTQHTITLDNLNQGSSAGASWAGTGTKYYYQIKATTDDGQSFETKKGEFETPCGAVYYTTMGIPSFYPSPNTALTYVIGYIYAPSITIMPMTLKYASPENNEYPPAVTPLNPQLQEDLPTQKGHRYDIELLATKSSTTNEKCSLFKTQFVAP